MALQWLTLIATMWLQSISGTNSNFPAYSSELKRTLSISQLQLSNLASASDTGKLLCWISGVASSYLPLWLVLLIGSLLGLIGYGFQFILLNRQLGFSPSYSHFFILNVLAGNSICWINTVCYIILIRNFPFDRQIAVGLSTSYVGLSAKIYTDIVDVVAPYSPFTRAKVFLLLNSVLPLVVCLAVAPLAVSDGIDMRKEYLSKLKRGFFGMYMITIVTGLFAVITTMDKVSLRIVPSCMILVGMIMILLLPLIIPLTEKIRNIVRHESRVHDESIVVNSSIELSMEEEDDEEENTKEFVEIGPKLMVRRVEFWLYFFVYLFGATLGLVYLNNLAQIGESRGCYETSSLVSLSSAFNFFGQLMPSLLDYFYPKSKRLISRALAMGGMMTPMCGAFFLLLNMHNTSLYISTAIIGLCTGAITSVAVSTTTQLFGTKNFGVNHNILVSNIPIGSFLFGDFAAMLYNRWRNDSEENCTGEKCYQITFIILGSLCVVGTLLALILHARTKKLYSHNRL